MVHTIKLHVATSFIMRLVLEIIIAPKILLVIVPTIEPTLMPIAFIVLICIPTSSMHKIIVKITLNFDS